MNQEELVEKTNLFYKFYPIASIFLCKPFEYQQQSLYFPGMHDAQPDEYVHVGEEMNGLWPFLLESPESIIDDPRNISFRES
jgi:hypothetical protein